MNDSDKGEVYIHSDVFRNNCMQYANHIYQVASAHVNCCGGGSISRAMDRYKNFIEVVGVGSYGYFIVAANKCISPSFAFYINYNLLREAIYRSPNFCWQQLWGNLASANNLFNQTCSRINGSNSGSGGSGSGGGSGGGGNGSGNNDEIIFPSPIELCNPKYFVTYATSKDCFVGATMIMENYGVYQGSPNCVFQLITDVNNGEYIKADLETYKKAINCINEHLSAGRPIIAGVSTGPASISGNNDNLTTHFIVITGIGYDNSSGMHYYTYMDTGTDQIDGYDTTINRLNYDSQTNGFYDNDTYQEKRYDVTHIRPNDGKDRKGTTSQI